MILGALSLGKTDALDGECVETEFFVLGVPLVPMGSRYCTWASGFRSQGFPIRLQWKSILFTYLRWWTVLVPLCAAFDALVFGTTETSTLTVRALHWGISLSVIALWIWVCFYVPRPNELARRQRRVLGFATGVRAWPEILTRESLAGLAGQLDETWRRRSLPDWRSRDALQVAGSDLLILYALLRYAHVLEPAAGWRAARDATWQRIQLDWSMIEPVVRPAGARR